MTKREFRDEFGSVQNCLLATFEEGTMLLSRVLADAVEGQWSWLARVRAGLLALLEFLDAEPGWARLLVIDAPSAGEPVLARRERALNQLGELLARQSPRPKVNSKSALPRALTSELIVGGVVSVIHKRMLHADGEPLSQLGPSLMSMIVLPYLGPEAARAELALTARLEKSDQDGPTTMAGLPIRATYRTAVVLQAIASAPRASNREIAMAAGLTDEGQTSRLLRRLEAQGVIENVGLGHAYGEPNAWLLTPIGERAAEVSARGLATQAMRTRSAPRRSARSACQGGAK